MSVRGKVTYTMNDEWYTPSAYVEAARTAMGSIDVDPASCAFAQKTVRATVWFSKEDDGLARPWAGNVWLTPPYTATAAWVATLAKRYTRGEIAQACLLVNASTETRWFQPLFDRPLCFVGSNAIATAGRIRFERDGPQKMSPVSGSAIAYFGTREHAFASAFCTFGRVVVPYDFPAAHRASFPCTGQLVHGEDFCPRCDP